MEVDTQRRQIILEFTQQVSKCSEQVSVAFKGDKFKVLIIFYNTTLYNPKPLLFAISNDYLTFNCFKRVAIFTGPEFGWLAEPIIPTKNDPYGLKFSSAAFLQRLDETITQSDCE
jgi:hypothetical protein